MIPPAHERLDDPTGNDENLKRVSSGAVIVAREILQDPNFEASVVLVCVHNKEGSYGLVLNRISHMPLSEIFIGVHGLTTSREIGIGGPVQQNELQILDITTTPAEDAFQIAPGVYIGGRWEDLDRMIATDPLTTRIFLGYSGWGPNQLESEIAIGAWDVYSVNVKQLLLNCNLLVSADHISISSFLKSIAL